VHRSVSRIPPHNLTKYRYIIKQTPISDLVFEILFKRYGLYQIGTYLRTWKRNPTITYPYMPSDISKDIYLYDFHAHSMWSDGVGTYENILNEIRQKQHLHGMAITEHPFKPNVLKKVRYIDEKQIYRSYKLNAIAMDFKTQGKLPKEFVTFPGSCELLTMLENDSRYDAEIIALGVSKDFIERCGGVKTIKSNTTAVELIEKIHDDNGLAVLPHPFFYTRSNALLRRKLTKNSRPDAFEGLNYSVGFMADENFQEFFQKLPFTPQLKTLSANFGYFNWMSTIVSQENKAGKRFNYPLARELASIGVSDAHIPSMIGAACTAIKNKPITSLEDLRTVFSKKETIPIYNPIWSKKTDKHVMFREMLEGYKDRIDSSVSTIKKKSYIKLLAYRFLIKAFSRVYM